MTRSIYEGARDFARDIAKTNAYAASRRQRKKAEMLFARLKPILRLDRLRLRSPNGARDEFLLAAAAQNRIKLAKLIRALAPLGPGLSRSALLLVKCADTAQGQARDLNDLAGSCGPIREPKTPSTCPT